MGKTHRRGQSILEYTLLLGVVIAAIVAVLFSQGGVREKVENTYNKTTAALNKTESAMAVGVFKE